MTQRRHLQGPVSQPSASKSQGTAKRITAGRAPSPQGQTRGRVSRLRRARETLHRLATKGRHAAQARRPRGAELYASRTENTGCRRVPVQDSGHRPSQMSECRTRAQAAKESEEGHRPDEDRAPCGGGAAPPAPPAQGPSGARTTQPWALPLHSGTFRSGQNVSQVAKRWEESATNSERRQVLTLDLQTEFRILRSKQ